MTHRHRWLLKGRCKGYGGHPAIRYVCEGCGRSRVEVIAARWV